MVGVGRVGFQVQSVLLERLERLDRRAIPLLAHKVSLESQAIP
jgi:hypothetical protein